MTPAAAPLFDLGDATLGFNGGPGFQPKHEPFCAIANDSFGNSSLVSFALGDGGTYTTIDVLGLGFLSGLAYSEARDVLYANSTDLSGQSSLQPIRDVENPAHFPLRASATVTVEQGFVGAFGLQITGADVPAISWRFHMYPVSLTKTSRDYQGFAVGVGQLTQRLYHDNGTGAVAANVILNRAAPAGGVSCSVAISGYTVSAS